MLLRLRVESGLDLEVLTAEDFAFGTSVERRLSAVPPARENAPVWRALQLDEGHDELRLHENAVSESDFFRGRRSLRAGPRGKLAIAPGGSLRQPELIRGVDRTKWGRSKEPSQPTLLLFFFFFPLRVLLLRRHVREHEAGARGGV